MERKRKANASTYAAWNVTVENRKESKIKKKKHSEKEGHGGYNPRAYNGAQRRYTDF